MPQQLSNLFADALTLAHTLHKGQVRKGSNTPYISHLLSVCSYVLEDGGTEDEAIAALLHDAVEDQGGIPTLKMILEVFGPVAAGIVETCTDSCELPKPPWRARKQAFLNSLDEASPQAVRVIAADKLHNLLSIHKDYLIMGEDVWNLFKGGREGTLWYYRELSFFFESCTYSRLPSLFLHEYKLFTDLLERDT